MPLPMEPTQFTVFTSASASASRMLPLAISIIGWLFSLVIPRPLHLHVGSRLVRMPIQDGFNPRFHPLVENADALDQRPVHHLPDQKLGLLPPFPVIVVRLLDRSEERHVG